MNELIGEDFTLRREMERLYTSPPEISDTQTDQLLALATQALANQATIGRWPTGQHIWETPGIDYIQQDGTSTSFSLQRRCHLLEYIVCGFHSWHADPITLVVNEAWYDPLAHFLPATPDRPAAISLDVALPTKSQLTALSKVLESIRDDKDIIEPKPVAARPRPYTPRWQLPKSYNHKHRSYNKNPWVRDNDWLLVAYGNYLDMSKLCLQNPWYLRVK